MSEKKPPTVDPRGRCGTSAGYKAHWRRGEDACAGCRAAHSQNTALRRKGGTPPPSRPARTPRIDPTPAVPAVGLPEMSTPTPTAPRREPAGETSRPDPQDKPLLTGPSPAPTPDDVPVPPDYLKAKGRALWESVTGKYRLTEGALVLLGEACRTADRLERFAAALSSRSVLWFEVGDIEQADEAGVPVVVNGMIGEARQLQTTLRQTLTQLGVIGVEAANAGGEKSMLDQLAERRAERLAAAHGGGM